MYNAAAAVPPSIEFELSLAVAELHILRAVVSLVVSSRFRFAQFIPPREALSLRQGEQMAALRYQGSHALWLVIEPVALEEEEKGL